MSDLPCNIRREGGQSLAIGGVIPCNIRREGVQSLVIGGVIPCNVRREGVQSLVIGGVIPCTIRKGGVQSLVIPPLFAEFEKQIHAELCAGLGVEARPALLRSCNIT